MKTYIYSDKNVQPNKVVFECQAKSILEADVLYKAALGKDPAKERYIACEVFEKD
jgi:hypothetical protein